MDAEKTKNKRGLRVILFSLTRQVVFLLLLVLMGYASHHVLSGLRAEVEGEVPAVEVSDVPSENEPESAVMEEVMVQENPDANSDGVDMGAEDEGGQGDSEEVASDESSQSEDPSEEVVVTDVEQENSPEEMVPEEAAEPLTSLPDVVQENDSVETPLTQEEVVQDLVESGVVTQGIVEKTVLEGELNKKWQSLADYAEQSKIKLADVDFSGRKKGDTLSVDEGLVTLLSLTTTEGDLKKAIIRSTLAQYQTSIADDLLADQATSKKIKQRIEKGLLESYSEKVQEALVDETFQKDVANGLENDPDIEPLLSEVLTPDVQSEILEKVVQNTLNTEKNSPDVQVATQEAIQNSYQGIVLKEVLSQKLMGEELVQQTLLDTLSQNPVTASGQTTPDLIKVTVMGPDGSMEIPFENVRFSVGSLEMIIEPTREFVPGQYEAEIEIMNPITEESQLLTQNFLWGVLAVNTDKDTYRRGDQAKVDIGVLDDQGRPVCDAQVSLSVIHPSGFEQAEEVSNTGNCSVMDSSNTLPDYQALVDFAQEGDYRLKVTSVLSDGRVRTTDTMVEVQPSPDFVIERQAATRLYPVGWAPMELKVYFNQEFKGELTDIVPADFKITEMKKDEKMPKFSITQDTGSDERHITWKVNVKANEVLTLGYLYDAPDVSPEFYTVGPLQIGGFEERRVWQIANDEPTIAADSTSDLRIHWKFNTGSGSTATDSSANTLDGTLTNMESVDWTTNTPTSSNENPYALDFDGVDEYVTVADSSLLDFSDTDDFTITGWFNRDTATTDDTVVSKSIGQLGANTGYNLYIDSVTDRLILDVADGVDLYTVTSSSQFTTTGWNHFAVVWDQNSTANTEIYINGTANSATESGTIGNIGDLSNALPFRVGAESDAGKPFDGKIDDVRVYGRVLTATEIATLAAGNSPGGVSGPALWLKANAGTTTSGADVSAWTDQSGNGYTFNQSTTASKPDLVSNTANFNPVITFDGSDDVLTSTNFFNDPVDVFAVLRNADTGTNDRAFFAIGTPDSGVNHYTSHKVNNSSGQSVASYYQDGTEYSVATTNLDNEFFLQRGHISELRNGTVGLEINGQSAGTSVGSGTPPTQGDASVGAGYTGTALSQYLSGDVAEIVVYGSEQAGTSTGKIESYLALKYGITLDQSSTGGGVSYSNSAGTTIWSEDGADTFEYDIAGLLQDDTSALDQVKSKSINADAILTVADATSQDDLDSLTWANNNGAASWTSTGAPTNYKILSRQWQAEEVNDMGTVDLEFDVADADFDVPSLQGGTGYYFVYDSDDDGSLSDETPILMSDSGTGGDDTASDNKWTAQHNFNHVVDNKIDFTIATLVTPPPTVTDANISITGGSGAGGAYIVGDQLIVSWNNAAAGDNNTGLTSVTADLSGWGGSATATMTDTTNCSGTAGNNIYEACYTLTSGNIDATNVNASVTATNLGGQTTTADTSNATVDNEPPTLTTAAISVTGATGTGGAFKAWDDPVGRWDDSATGDNNADTISSVNFDLSDFRSGDTNRTGANTSDIWTAGLSGVLDSQGDTNNNVTVTATDNAGNQTTLAGTNNYTVDTNLPSISAIISVAGDSSAPYYDLSNDSSTLISFTSTDVGTGVSACKWDTSDTTYDLMANSCASTSSCTTNLSGEGAKTVYLSCIDGAGNTTVSNTQVDYTVDETGPSGTSITPASTRIIDNSYPTFVVDDGTDTVSGIDTSSRILERSEATYGSNTCGSFGGFSSVVYSGTYPNITDDSTSGSKCYQYRWSVSDNAGNASSATTTTIVRVPLTTLVIADGDGQSYGDSTHNPIGYTLPTSLQVQVTDGGTNTAQAGEVTVDFAITSVPSTPTAAGQSLNTASDATDASGMAQVSLTFGDRAGNYQVQASSTDAVVGNTVTFTETAGDYSDLVVIETDTFMTPDPFSVPQDSVSPTISLTTNAASYELHLTPDRWPLSGVDQIMNWFNSLGFGWNLDGGTVTAFAELSGDPTNTTVYSCSGDACQGAQVLDIDLYVGVDYLQPGGTYTNSVDFSIENITY